MPLSSSVGPQSRVAGAAQSNNQPQQSSQAAVSRPTQSRYTTNSMFQRQLSQNAMNIGQHHHQQQSQSGRTGVGQRTFQRQMTASQLLHSGGSPVTIGDPLVGPPLGARQHSTANLTNQSSTKMLPAATALDESGDSSVTGAKPKTAKNKRIISRMLSISAIHTSVTSSLLSSASSNSELNSSKSGPTNNSSSSSVTQLQTTSNGNCSDSTLSDRLAAAAAATASFNSAASTTTTPASTSLTSSTMLVGGSIGAGEALSDKIDSSFVRSRSSSTSSQTATGAHISAAGAPPSGGQQTTTESCKETISCLCFLDWSASCQGGASLAASAGTNSDVGQPSSTFASSSQDEFAAASPAASSQASSGQQQQQQTSQQQQQATANQQACNNKSSAPIDSSGQVALWLGTSQGCVLLVALQMPDSDDNRVLQLQSVVAEPIPQAALKLPGAILCLSTFVMDSRMHISGSQAPPGGLGGQMGASQSSSLEADLSPTQLVGTNSQSAALSGGSNSNTAAAAAASQQQLRGQSSSSTNSSFDCSRAATFVALVSSKQARIYQVLPTTTTTNQPQQHAAGRPTSAGGMFAGDAMQITADSPLAKFLINKSNCVKKCDLTDSSFVCKSGLIHMRQPDEPCLVNYLATGNIQVFSLPRLNQLLDADFVPYSSALIGSSMKFSRNGHCLYQPSEGEICKFTISSHYKSLINEMTGSAWVAREMPEMPRTNFFKSLFSVSGSTAGKNSERDELFGEVGAGKGARGVAKHIASSSSSAMDKLKGAAHGTMGHDVRMAREALEERGEKLGEVEDRTQQMMNQAESYASSAHQLAQKFKDKKWYQF